MPTPNANDPLRTTDHAPSEAPPARDLIADFAQGSSPVYVGTAAYVPGYAIEAVLGRGGMGVVYKARHLALKRTVALKMVLAGGHAGPHELARFRIEAEAAARLQHPNIVQIHEVGEAGGILTVRWSLSRGATSPARSKVSRCQPGRRPASWRRWRGRCNWPTAATWCIAI